MDRAELLRRAAARAAQRPGYLASALAALAESEGLDDTALAARLGCAEADLPALRLCRRPARTSFARDVQTIAARFGLEAGRLAEAIRLAEALEALGQAPVAGGAAGLLTAARDRPPEESEP